ncbi:MAG: hypothetical protein ACO1OB_23240 [Archangium sp.]
MALQVRIASPCSEKWEEMKGDERVRFCARCKLDVFNLKEMTEADARALLFQKQGRVCGRVYQRPDGTVLTKDCPTGVAKLRRRALAAITMVAAMLLAVVSFRVMSKKECGTSDGRSDWFGNTFGLRYTKAKEALRDTKTFGPIIEELDPQRVMAGDMMPVPPSVPAGS